ncbi:restriction endonuclease subunit S [Streptomyces sp. SM11]|uniref:restriction endonuclease subunit S n=1 Tax=Streptomyces sp. SM11 TaxID=565557 RepID=UPI000CD53F62|nr:restriction endonuclease subunit S [Streptomyces sp. SM11]
MTFPTTWPTHRIRFLFDRRDVRGAEAPLASATKSGVTLRSELDYSVWNPDSDVSNYKLVEPDDFVIGLRSFQHGISHSTVRGIVSPAYTVLRQAGALDPHFTKHYFRSSLLISHLANVTQGIRQGQAIDIEAFRNLLMPVPPLEEQRRIADFLDVETARIDRLIVATQKQSALLNDRLIETFRELTTTGGGEETATTGVPWMPRMNSTWALMKIGQSFRASSGTTPRTSDSAYFGGENYWINTGDLRDGTVESPKKTVTDLALADYPTLKVYRPGSLAVAMYGATTGRVGILGTPACVNQACCVLSELGPVSSLYAFFWFRGHREEILRLASGGGQPNISQDLVRSLRLPAPFPREEQEEIAARAAAVETAVSRQRQLQMRRALLLAERRQALITAAVTGQFDVSTAGGRNVADGVQA